MIAPRKAWIKDLLQKREKVERALGVPLGKQLGCGAYGCVFESTVPWVVKLTLDQTEGPIWEQIITLVDQEDYGADGFARLKSVIRLLPDVRYRGRSQKLYAIVHEDTPAAFEFPMGRGAELSSFTCERLDLPEASKTWADGMLRGNRWWSDGELADYLRIQYQYDARRAARVEYSAADFYATVRAVQAFRNAELRSRRGSERSSYYERPYSRSELLQVIDRAINAMRGPVGGPIGESLGMLVSNGIVLRDLHLGNIGWRRYARIAGQEAPRCLLVFDPGHTPTSARVDIEERLVANGRWTG